MSVAASASTRHRRARDLLPVAVAGPVLAVSVLYVVGFTLWTTWLSFTASTLLPDYSWIGLKHDGRLLADRVFQVAYGTLVVYGLGFILVTMAWVSSSPSCSTSASGPRTRYARSTSTR